MKISHFVRQFFPGRGGLEDFVFNLSKQQLRAGHRVRVVTCNKIFTRPQETLPEMEVVEGIIIHRVPYWGSSRYPIAAGIRHFLDGSDIVHVHAIDFFFDFLALQQLFRRRPMIATTHGGFFHTKNYHTIKRFWFNAVTPISMQYYDAVIACSPSDYRLFEDAAGDRLCLIDNGANVEKFDSAGSPTLRKGIVVVGRFGKNKRLDRALDAFVALRERDTDWHVHICGVDSDWTQADLVREIEQRGLQGYITIHYGLSNEELRDVVGLCSFYLSASEYEGFALALTEAMSAGLLGIVNAKNEVFVDFKAKNGHVTLVDIADPQAAANGILETYQRALGNYAMQRSDAMKIADGYSWQRSSKRYEALYRKILDARVVTPSNEIVS